MLPALEGEENGEEENEAGDGPSTVPTVRVCIACGGLGFVEAQRS